MTPRPPLNPDQSGALADISAFLIGPDKEFFLTGAPGVGKTFTTHSIVEEIPIVLANYATAMGKTGNSDKEIVLTSTTNKAAAVLAEETGKPTSTIYSFLGLVPKKDFSTGRTSLKKNNRWRVHSNIIIFIDEASMIDKALYHLIQEATDNSCKILYIGDKNQLPPVMEKISLAVKLADDPNAHYEITTPVRNSGSPALMDLCNRLRADILNETPKDQLTKWLEVPGEIEHVDGPQLQTLVTNLFGPGGIVKPADKDLKGRILCYTNASVIGYNQHIRGIRGLPLEPTVGENLISNRHVDLGGSKVINVEGEVFIEDVSGPVYVDVDRNNHLEAYDLEISNPFIGRNNVRIPKDPAEFKELSNYYKRNKDWHNFYRLQEMFVDLRDRDASTVYKAQGSSYDFVIMIMNDIFSSRDINQLRRMLYVGASRAREKIYVYDKNIHNSNNRLYR